jgi:hypothetical protein
VDALTKNPELRAQGLRVRAGIAFGIVAFPTMRLVL